MPDDLTWRLAAAMVGLLGGLAGAVISVWLPAEAGPRPSPGLRRLALMGAAGLAAGLWSSFVLPGAPALLGAALGAALLLIAVIDGEHYWLPNVLTLPLGAAGLVIAALSPASDLVASLFGAALGFLVLTAVALAYRRLRDREGLGGGDPRLLAAIGAWVGWIGLPSVLVWGSAAGLSWVLARALAKRPMAAGDILPYGVFLAIGAWIVWLYGPIGGRL